MSIVKISFLNLIFLLVASITFSHEKIWPEKRLRQLWPNAQSFVAKQVVLTPHQIAELKNDGVQIGNEDRSPTFYFIKEKENKNELEQKTKTLGVILFIDEYGDNGLIEISVAMGTDGRIKKTDIWEHSENSLIAKEDFLKQFNDKNAKDLFVINKDFIPIRDANKASEAVARGLRKALKISNIIFEKK